MPLDKAIEHGKEKRKRYYGSKAIDCTCRNHGSCEWCKENRLYKNSKRMDAMSEKIKEYKGGRVWLILTLKVYMTAEERLLNAGYEGIKYLTDYSYDSALIGVSECAKPFTTMTLW